MRLTIALCCALLSLTSSSVLRAQEAPEPPAAKPAEAERIATLIKQLGARRYATRANAADQLRALGKRALPALNVAAEKAESLEARQAAKRLLTELAKPADLAGWDWPKPIKPMAGMGVGPIPIPPGGGPGGPGDPAGRPSARD